MDLTVLSSLSYGLYAIGAHDGDRPCGCIVSTVMQVTAENPMLTFCINKQSHTLKAVLERGRFSVSILSKKADPKAIGRLGFFSGSNTDKFATVAHELMDGDLPIMAKGSCGYLRCEVVSCCDAETHLLVMGRLKETRAGDGEEPMTYEYYHKVIKGKVPRQAPNYIGDQKAKA